MIDSYGRKINYLRISVTDRCNLRCCYCMPAYGVELLDHSDILSFEEIFEFTKIAVEMGITKVRLTGGEPLVRRGIVELVRKLSKIDGIDDFSMTTNGILLSQYAKELFNAGLKRVNISLDTTDTDQYRKITRYGDINLVFEGIEAAQNAGLNPVKINCVSGDFSWDCDTRSVKDFAKSNNLQIRIIHQMYFETGCFHIVEGGNGGDCPQCNRLRLSSDGYLRPCLFSDTSFNIRKLGNKQAMIEAIAAKPEAGGPCGSNLMHRIGG